jgi:hypothetical protein
LVPSSSAVADNTTQASLQQLPANKRFCITTHSPASVLVFWIPNKHQCLVECWVDIAGKTTPCLLPLKLWIAAGFGSAFRWSADGLSVLLVADFRVRLTVWSLVERRPIYLPGPKFADRGIAFSPRGDQLAVLEVGVIRFALRQQGKRGWVCFTK